MAAGGWEPQMAVVTELCQMFQMAHTSSSDIHRDIYNRLEEYAREPEFNCYLAYVLVHVPDAFEGVRAAAGLLLKKNVLAEFESLVEGVQEYIKSEVVKVIGDPSALVQATAGVIITSVVGSVNFAGWPGLLGGLLEMMGSESAADVRGALSVMRKLCEDYPYEMHRFENGMPLTYLIPKLMHFFTHPEKKLRENSLACVLPFISLRSAGFLAVTEDFVLALYDLAMDEHTAVRRLVCDGMVQMLQVRADLFLDRMPSVIEYMLVCSASDDELLALEACEFWASFAEAAIAAELIRPFLDSLIPVLLKNMIYSEYDLMMLGGDEDDSDVPDLPQDIAPRFHSAAVVSRHMSSNAYDSDGDDADSDAEEEGGELGSAQYSAEWNLRKSAASAIDVLAGVYKDELLEYIMPVVSEMMNSTEWEERESAILTLGAISVGCGSGLAEFLPDMLAHLLDSSLSDPVPLVRKISCWTLSRYAEWVVWLEDPDVYLYPYVRAILSRILDRNKQVQEAACSAMAVVAEKASTSLVPLFEDILSTYAAAMASFQIRSLRLLYDAIGALAENTQRELRKKEYAAIVLPPLIEKWDASSIDDPSLFPLMEAITSVSSAVGMYFIDYAEPLFLQAAEIIQGVLDGWANPEPGVDLPPKEFLICALDMLSGVVDAVGAEVEPFVVQTSMLDMVAVCLTDDYADVRQSSIALLGDLAKAIIHVVADYLEAFLPILIDNLDPTHSAVANNVAWAIGEIAMQVGAALDPYVPEVVQRLIVILKRPQITRSLSENASIALGRLGIESTALVAPHLDSFLLEWCSALRSILDDPEKESAFHGMCLLIAANPEGAVSNFPILCDAIASWQEPPDHLATMFSQILNAFKDSMDPAQWATFYAGFPAELKDTLFQQYTFN